MVDSTFEDTLKVLIIEDNPGDTKLLKATLGVSPRVMYKVDDRCDLVSGIKTLSENNYDILLLDLGLPDSDQIDTLKKVRENNPDIPIVILTVANYDGLGLAAIKNGAQDFILKGELKYSILEKSIRFAIERKKREQQEITFQNFYEKTFEESYIGMIQLTLEGYILKINKKASIITGYQEQVLIGQKIERIIHNDDVQRSYLDLANLLSGKINDYSVERRIINQDGMVIWVNMTGTLINPADRPVIILLTIEDINIKKRLENIVEHSLENYKFLAENSPDIIARIDKRMDITYINSAVKSITGNDPGFYIGKNLSQVSEEDDFVNWKRNLMEVFRTKEKDYALERLKTEFGTKTFEVILVPEIDAVGIVESVLIIARDITDRIKAEEEIRRKNILLENIIENNPIGMLIAGKDGNIIHYNRTVELIWGGAGYIPMNQMTKYKGWWVDSGKEISNEEWPLYRACKYGETSINEKIKIKCFDGQLKTILASAIPILNSKDEIENILVLNQDVTGLLKMETDLKATLAEKELLMREIHHRVKNNLQIIISLFNLQKNLLKDNSIEEIFDDSRNRVRSMMIIHDKLYRSGVLNEIELGGYLRDLLSELKNSFTDNSKKIDLSLTFENLIVNTDDAINLGLIVNELVVNVYKYAFRIKNEGILSLNLSVRENKIFLNIKDNGDGFPEDINIYKADTLGLLLVNSLVSQLKGKIEVLKENGVEFRLSFPYLLGENRRIKTGVNG